MQNVIIAMLTMQSSKILHFFKGSLAPEDTSWTGHHCLISLKMV